MDRLRRGLIKKVPDHIQIVGPRSAGKTVLVNELVNQMRLDGSPFGGAIRWDLGHQPPGDDHAFLTGLRDHIALALDQRHADWARTLREYGTGVLDGLKEVLSVLNDEDIRVLVVLDGLEKSLASGSFTRNLWDNLADLGRIPSLRYITTSRGKPHELIRDPDSAVSEFWGIFDQNPITVGCFDEEDIDQAIALLRGKSLSVGARTELLNWTNAFPPLALCLLNELVEHCDQAEINPPHLVQAAERAQIAVEPTLSKLWNDCTETAKELQRAVIADGSAPTVGRSARDIGQLLERGFAARKSDRLQRPCQLLARHLSGIDDGDGGLRRLFGTEAAFARSAKGALEHRLNQLDGLDAGLKHSIERGIEDLPEHPENCLSNIRYIVDRGLELIWAVELINKAIPSEWFDTWNHNGERGQERWNGQFPTNRGHKVRLLYFMTGTERSHPVAKHVSRSTYTLLAAAQGFGDFGQHIDGAVIHPCTALAAMSVCVEMASSLLRELPRAGARGIPS
jgi:hypothetical protein